MYFIYDNQPSDTTNGSGVYSGVPSGASSTLSILDVLFDCLTPMRVTGMMRSQLLLSVALSVISQYGGSPSPVYCSTEAVVT